MNVLISWLSTMLQVYLQLKALISQRNPNTASDNASHGRCCGPLKKMMSAPCSSNLEGPLGGPKGPSNNPNIFLDPKASRGTLKA